MVIIMAAMDQRKYDCKYESKQERFSGKYRVPKHLYDEIRPQRLDFSLMFRIHLLVYPLIVLFALDYVTYLMALDWKLSILTIGTYVLLVPAIEKGIIPVYYPRSPLIGKPYPSMVAMMMKEGAIVRTCFNIPLLMFYLSADDLARIDQQRIETALSGGITWVIAFALLILYLIFLFVSPNGVTPAAFTRRYDSHEGERPVNRYYFGMSHASDKKKVNPVRKQTAMTKEKSSTQKSGSSPAVLSGAEAEEAKTKEIPKTDGKKKREGNEAITPPIRRKSRRQTEKRDDQ